MTRLILTLCLLSLACTTSAMLSASPIPAPIPRPLRRPTPPPAFAMATVTAVVAVYVRQSPNHQSVIVGHLYNGKVVTVTACKSGWARIGAGGWVNARYLNGVCQ